jgi:hypothetical protein
MNERFNRAVVSKRRSARQTEVLAERDPRAKLQFFPTPPWATRAFLIAAGIDLSGALVWEPFCGAGHMAAVLEEAGGRVFSSDIYPHGFGDVGSFVGGAVAGDVIRRPWPERGDWVISNPAFSLAVQAFERGLLEARNVAMLCRLQWLETEERYRLFSRERFEVWAYAERVPMTEFAWDPDASSMTSYAWFVLRADRRPQDPGSCGFDGFIIPPGAKERFTRAYDARLFAGDPPVILRERDHGPLFEKGMA